MSNLFLLSSRFAGERRWLGGVALEGARAHQLLAVGVFSSTHWLSHKSSSTLILVNGGCRRLMSSSSPSLHPHPQSVADSPLSSSPCRTVSFASKGLFTGAWVSGWSQLRALMTYHCH